MKSQCPLLKPVCPKGCPYAKGTGELVLVEWEIVENWCCDYPFYGKIRAIPDIEMEEIK
ncbi:hypothetical protein M0R04_08540 [Candidatus Dojkabacteria bacterium]|jgi:hypothetical protein|nr:hypothetical protein [Candidatus Dojkabacteria bacterium]